MNNKVKILFVGNGPNSNRGCEAIVRGTTTILKDTFGSISCTNIYNAAPNEKQIEINEQDIQIAQFPLDLTHKNLLERILKALLIRKAPTLWTKFYLNSFIPHIKSSDIVLSIGGDNYSLDYGIPRFFVLLGKLIKAHNKPFIIFGASVGPFDNAGSYRETILEHLRNEVDLILAREEESVNYLRSNQIQNVKRMADPAFLMQPAKPKNLSIPRDKLHEAIGLNMSPLILKRHPSARQNPAEWVKELALKLKREMQRPIILIYHVTSSHTNDLKLLSEAYELIPANERKDIFLVDNGLNAPELKWIISQLFCLIGARTHATIAALSSEVPTISLAYSIKAYGINIDLFGHTDYVVDGTACDPSDILNTVHRVEENKKVIRATLQSKMEQTRQLAYSAGQYLKNLLISQPSF